MRATKPKAETSVMFDKIGTDRPSRHRFEDIQELAASIALEGLRHPVLLMPGFEDGGGQLLKGARRIAAVKVLGWRAIPARIVDSVEDACRLIKEQQDADSRPRLLSEWVDLGAALETLERRERPTDRHHPQYETSTVIGITVTSSAGHYKRGRALVGAARSASRPAYVVDVAKSALEQVERGEVTLTHAVSVLRKAEQTDPVNAVGGDGLPLIPAPARTARTRKARKLRVDWIKAYAGQGATSREIAERLGISTAGLKAIVRAEGLTIPADAALSKYQQKVADPNRAIVVALDDLDAMGWSLDRIDPASLDPAQALFWAAQLKDYARSIDRVSRKILKEWKS